MQYLTRLWTKPTIPLLMINASLNQQKTSTLLRKLQKIDYARIPAFAMVVDLDNHMPVQVDTISEYVQEVREKYGVKVYGFCHSHVSLESYYLLSKADEIYTLPTTIFELKRGVRLVSTEELLQKVGISKRTIKSDENVIGKMMDSFTSANTSRYLNSKFSQIGQRIYEESISNRLALADRTLQAEAPLTMLGTEALTRGYVDKTGAYYDILKELHPEHELSHVRVKQKWSTRTLQLLVASPIILILFFIKVLIKYSIIMWLWLKHKNNEKAKAIAK